MLNFRRLPYVDTNIRGALTLGALLAFIVVVAIVGTLRIYTQLDSVASLQRQLVRSQEQLYEVLRLQFDEEIGVRGYLATKQPYMLDPYSAATDDFSGAMRRLELTARQLRIPGLQETLLEMEGLHRQWETRVAKPIQRTNDSNAQLRLESLGKLLVDQLRADANRVSGMLEGRMTQAQIDLRRGINETLGGALLSILVFGLVGIIFVGSRRRMLARIERERRIIETLQRAFRTGWDELPRSKVGTAYISATRDASVGGDLFDLRRLDSDRGLLIVADVSGKGIEAAVNTAFVKYSIRTLALTLDDPAQILAAFNGMFLDTIKDPGLFVVAFVGILDARTLRLRYASAGHSGAFLRRDGDVRQLRVTGPIVGLDRDFEFESETVELEPRDLLVLATDGLTEARDRTGRSLEDAGAMRLLRELPTEPQECADQLVSAVRRRSGGRIVDDLALLVVRIDETQREPAVKQEGEAA